MVQFGIAGCRKWRHELCNGSTWQHLAQILSGLTSWVRHNSESAGKWGGPTKNRDSLWLGKELRQLEEVLSRHARNSAITRFGVKESLRSLPKVVFGADADSENNLGLTSGTSSRFTTDSRRAWLRSSKNPTN